MNEAVEKSLNEMITPEAQRLKENIEQFKSQVQIYRDENRTPAYIGSFKKEAVNKIKNQYQLDFENESAKYKMKDKVYQEGYNKDIHKNSSDRLLKISEWKMEINAMDDEELRQSVTNIISGSKKVYESGYLNIIKTSLRKRNLTIDYGVFKKHVNDSELNYPWRHIEDGIDNSAKLKFYNNIGYGQVKLLADDVHGKLTPFVYNIEELI